MHEPPRILPSLACNLDSDLLLASMPLFAAEQVEAIEWSFDALYRRRDVPAWFHELLEIYAGAGRLVGHGIYFSLFSGKWKPEQTQWLQHLSDMADRFRFDHVSEHFGFMTGENFHAGAPMTLPFNQSTLRIGRDRLERIAQAARCPAGLENLAFACSLDEVLRHGAFLEQLIEPVNGFLILDVHNLYCQMHNFRVDADRLLGAYPLARVREIHISGGSWEDSPYQPGRPVRRDTHDGAVPGAVFDLLQWVAPQCPNLKLVVLEQLGTALHTDEARDQFRADFQQMRMLIANMQPPAAPTHDFHPPTLRPMPLPAEDDTLYTQQNILSEILENASNADEAHLKLLHSPLAQSDWRIEQWDMAMLDTACAIAQKWKRQAE